MTIAAVGDTMLGNAGELPPDPESIFAGVDTELTSGAQIVFANLEGTLTDATTSKCGPKGSIDCYAFKDPPSYAQYFKKAGFTVLNDANNHSYDFGPAGQAQTVQVIHAAGMAQTGLPGEITLVTANRVRWRSAHSPRTPTTPIFSTSLPRRRSSSKPTRRRRSWSSTCTPVPREPPPTK